MAIACASCDAEQAADARFCSMCGASLKLELVRALERAGETGLAAEKKQEATGLLAALGCVNPY